MNYINKDKNYMTDKERIKYLEESIRELRKEKENLKKEKWELKARLEEEIKRLKSREEKLIAYYKWYVDKEHNLTEVEDIITENIKLKESLDIATKCSSKEEDWIIRLSEENKKLKEDNRFLTKICKEYMEKENIIEVTEFTELYKDDLEKENKKLKNIIEYRKKKADKNQEKANQIDEIMNLPLVMVDWKIDWSKVAVYYCI